MYEFDLKTFLKTVWGARKLILINCGIAAVVAVVVAFSIPKEYSASASLASETQEEGGLSGGLSSLASMAGVNFNSGTDALVPALYPDVIRSNKFLVGLFDVEVRTQDGEVRTDYRTYLKEHTRSPWWGEMIGAVIKAVTEWIPREDAGAGSLVNEDGKVNPFWLGKDDWGIIGAMRSLIGCEVDDDTQVITLSVQAQDPLVAAMMVDSVRAHLQSFITQYHTNKARVDLEYYRKLEMDTREAYMQAQRQYADFCDAHKGAILQAYISEQESLENELQLSYTAYSQVKQQVQLAEAKVQECTPAFTEIEGAYVPIKADSPRKIFILFGFVFLTFFGTVGWIYVKLLFFHHER